MIEGLAAVLRGTERDELTLTFDELASIVPDLPGAASRYPEWWSNEASAQPQSRAWLDAGLRVAAVELQGYVTFVRVRDRLARLELLRIVGDRETVVGTLALQGGAIEPDAGARWLVDESFYAVLPDGSWPRRVRPADGAAFLVACWFSLRDPDRPARLVDVHGHVLAPDEARSLVDSLSGTGTEPQAGEQPPGTDPSWSSVSLRAPDRSYDPDAAPMRDLYLKLRAEQAARKAAGLPEPPAPAPRPRPTPPDGPGWHPGRELVDPRSEPSAAIVRGARVFDEFNGLGTILSVVPQRHKTEALVRFDSGSEGWRTVFGLLVHVPDAT